jgi:hypothetical protein
MQKVAINICDCEGEHEDFPIEIYEFDDIGRIELPKLCPNSDLGQLELFNKFEKLVKTIETNKNWTLYSVYVGLIGRVSKNLFYCSFGDIDEVGENSFYISGILEEVIDFLLDEWGDFGPNWKKLFENWSTLGTPTNIVQDTLFNWELLFAGIETSEKYDLEGLEAGLFLNLEDEELLDVYRKH